MSGNQIDGGSLCRSTPLKKQLDDTRQANLKNAGHVRSATGYDPVFFPLDVIEEVLSRDQVESVLGCPCNWCENCAQYGLQRRYEKRTTYLEFVMTKALKLFALLVSIGIPALIGDFRDRGDDILEEKLDIGRLKSVYLVDIEKRFQLPAIESILFSFLNFRHRFCPPVFNWEWFEHWDANKALPFINTEYIGEGGYGKVYSFQIYPGYEDFKFEDSVSNPVPEFALYMVLTEKQPKRKFAMKEVGLPTGPTESLNEEASTLTKIRDELEDEKHIIKVLKIFRRGDKIHFIFPLARGNLVDFMSDPWNHQPNCNHPICQNTIWDQAVGMLKALAKFHRPPKMSHWRGYHADIKRT